MRCPKCAGSAAYAFFGAALNGSWPSGSTDSWIAQTAAKRHGATPIKQLMRDVGFRGRFPWASWRAVPEAVWQDYFIFTLVRSPWTRAVNAFQYCADLGKGGPLVAEWKQQKLQTRDIFGRHCARPASTPCWREHVQPMGPCVIGPAGEPRVEYGGGTAGRDLGRVLSTIVSEINKRNQALPTPPRPLSLTAGRRKLTRPDEDAGKTRKALGNPGIPSRRVREGLSAECAPAAGQGVIRSRHSIDSRSSIPDKNQTRLIFVRRSVPKCPAPHPRVARSIDDELRRWAGIQSYLAVQPNHTLQGGADAGVR